MKKKIIFFVLLMINVFFIYARESTPYDELQMIGNYISTYYMRYKVLPESFSELEKMSYFTNDDIGKRIRGIKKNYKLDIKIYDTNNVLVSMRRNEEKYRLEIFFGPIHEYNIFNNNNLVYKYQKDPNGDLILEDNTYEVTTTID